jgi:hypothetical protein
MAALGQGGLSRIGTNSNPLVLGAAGSPTDVATFTHNLGKTPVSTSVRDINGNILNIGLVLVGTSYNPNQVIIANLGVNPIAVTVEIVWEDLSAQFDGDIDPNDPRIALS